MVIFDNRLEQLLKVVKTSIFDDFKKQQLIFNFYNPMWLSVINLTGLQVKKLTIKPGLVVEIATLNDCRT